MVSFDELPELPKGAEIRWWKLHHAKRRALKKLIDQSRKRDDSWTIPQLSNSWEHYGSPYHSVGYWKDSDDQVHLTGCAKSGTLGEVLFILPENYRPGKDRVYPVATYNDSVGKVTVRSTGEIVVGDNCSTTWTSLDGILFRV